MRRYLPPLLRFIEEHGDLCKGGGARQAFVTLQSNHASANEKSLVGGCIGFEASLRRAPWLGRRTPAYAGVLSLLCRAVQVGQAERPLLRDAQERDSHRHVLCGGEKRAPGNTSAHRLVERPPVGQRIGGQQSRGQNNSSCCGGWSAGSAELAPEKSFRVECGHAPGGMDAGIRTLRLRSKNERR